MRKKNNGIQIQNEKYIRVCVYVWVHFMRSVSGALKIALDEFKRLIAALYRFHLVFVEIGVHIL